MPSTHRINRAFSVKSSLEQDISPINWKIEPTSSKGSIKEVLMLTEHPVWGSVRTARQFWKSCWSSLQCKMYFQYIELLLAVKVYVYGV
jgi:hypothetical protein